MSDDEKWMMRALELATQAELEDEVPVGAVLVENGSVISEGWNRPISGQDPSAHAEIIAIRNAARVKENYRLPGTTLYVTLEPCIMCAGAIIHARIARLVFGAHDSKAGAAGSILNVFEISELNHKPVVLGGVKETECGDRLTAFFKSRR